MSYSECFAAATSILFALQPASATLIAMAEQTMLRSARAMGVRHRNSTPAPRRAVRSKPRLSKVTPEHIVQLAALLAEKYPDATVELDHSSAYQLICATILAAQSTDRTINTITPAVFAKYPDASALAAADQGELEKLIYASGFFRMKAKHLIGMARACVERHGGEIPSTMDELVALPGVARKTANVVLGCWFHKQEGIVVDTHVARLAGRLGLTANTDPIKIEADLQHLVPRPQWTMFAHGLIWHGRRVCNAKQPDCSHCTLAPLCPSAGVLTVPKRGGKAKVVAKAGKAKPTRRRA
jgi:endonuclease-3